MREHVLEDSRMHYTVLDAGGPSNIVPGTAKAEYTLRSYSYGLLREGHRSEISGHHKGCVPDDGNDL